VGPARALTAMSLDKGSRLGPYEIEAAIGAGGMGEVYRARDTRLDRIVAIKVLADRRLHDEGLKQRFEREARTISRLNHPHICSLHDIGQHNGVDFLVMEYLEGESLANRLTAAPPLAIEEVLRFAIEIAESLSEAHRLGIVHRDLKPGNVMITRSGVKLLDFGLAKFDPRPGRMAMSGSTVAAGQPQALTAEGTILGTWRLSSCKARTSTRARTSLPSEPSSTRWPPARGPSPETATPA
jgi:serine/threonine protein kinase